ncbi:hypothetical protein PTT_18367 [Pyrenophora teres f. teres 0-1]|uniref:Uncharacterized protein n=1 Tax=Pyrenophora teres f. teres (strain 0-1) TaxID=861557 RepID=E3S6K1_PYRTT|nr:hypothetical protein PTT_18367 [Pyrenophora teres f. teres 0-1]
MADQNDEPTCSREASILVCVLEIKIIGDSESTTFIISTALLEAHAPKLAQHILHQCSLGFYNIELTYFSIMVFGLFERWLKKVPNDTSIFKASRARALRTDNLIWTISMTSSMSTH